MLNSDLFSKMQVHGSSCCESSALALKHLFFFIVDLLVKKKKKLQPHGKWIYTHSVGVDVHV